MKKKNNKNLKEGGHLLLNVITLGEEEMTNMNKTIILTQIQKL